MQLRRLHCSPDLHLDLDAIRLEFELPGPFTADAQAEAAALALLPAERLDATDLALVTIDPAGSRDLDQAVAVEAHGSGWRVRYAIADVGAWVAPGGAIDRDARARTQTYYAPDRRTPLHPPSLGEQAGSLLPDGDRPAVLWTIDVDDAGETTAIDVAAHGDEQPPVSLLVVPLSAQGELTGALIVTTERPIPATLRQSIETLASTVSLALESASLTEDLARRHRGVLRALDRLERRLATRAPLVWTADHYLLELERR